MPIDVSMGTGGQRNSRTGRSSAERIDTGSSKVRSRRTQREVLVEGQGAAAGAAAQGAIGEALANFSPMFKQAAREQEQIEFAKIREDNRQEIARVEAEVLKDRKAAREAIVSGNYSQFINDGFKDRSVVVETFEGLTAKLMAQEDYNEDVAGIRARIRDTPMFGRPEDAVDQAIEQNTKGGSDAFASSYAKSVATLAQKDIDNFKEERLNFQQLQAERGGTQAIAQMFETGQVPYTVEGYTYARQQLMGSMSPVMTEVAATLRAAEIVDNLMIKKAAAGDNHALSLLTAKDPSRDGTSIKDRRPGEYEKAVAANIKAEEATNSLAGHAAIENIETRISAIDMGKPMEGDDLANVYVDLMRVGQEHGTGSAWDAQFKRLGGKIKDNAIKYASLTDIAQGKTVWLSDSEYNKLVPSLLDGTAAQQMVDEGLVPSLEVAQAKIDQQLQMSGVGTDMRQKLTRALVGSTNVEQIGQTFETLRRITAGQRPVGDYLDEDGEDAFHLMMDAHLGGMDPVETLMAFREADKAAQGQFDPNRYFEEQLENPGSSDKSNTKVGERGAMAVAAKAVDRLTFQDYDVDWDDTSQEVRDEYRRAVNRAAFMLKGKGRNDGETANLANRMMEGRMGWSHDGDDAVLVIRREPDATVDGEGNIGPAKTITREVVKEAADNITGDETNSATRSLIGDFGGVFQDPMTKTTGSLAVHTKHDGYSNPVRISPGRTIKVDADEAELAGFMTRVEQADGMAVLKAPPAPEKGQPHRIKVSPTLTWMYETENKYWHLRYNEADATLLPTEVLDAKNKEKRDAVLGPDQDALGDIWRPRPSNPVADLHTSLIGTRKYSKEARPLGSPSAAGMTAHPPQESERNAIERAFDWVLGAFEKKGVVGPEATAEAEFAKTLKEATNLVQNAERKNGGWLDDKTAPAVEGFMNKTKEYIESHEKRVLFAYDDATSKAWVSSKDGNPTIGVGFNLNRDDAREMLDKVGANYDAVMKGGGITSKQADKLLEITTQEAVNYVRDAVGDAKLANHQWRALISLAFNNPSLVANAPKLKDALRREDWAAVEWEIRENSGSQKPDALPGIAIRRNKEANLWRGYGE